MCSHILYLLHLYRTDVYVTTYEEVPELSVETTDSMFCNPTYGVPPIQANKQLHIN